MKVHGADIVVAGSGLAGLAAALSAGRDGRDVVLLSDAAESASSRSGGWFRAAGASYSAEQHFIDTVEHGCYLAERTLAKALAQDAPLARKVLEDAGLQLRPTPVGFRVGGGGEGDPPAGRRLIEGLENLLPASIERLSGLAWELLLGPDGSVAGLLAYDQEVADWLLVSAPCVILATGGAAGVFRWTDGSPEATGDGVALAFRAGAPLADMEFVQFWPLAAVIPGGACTGLPFDYLSRTRLLTADGEDITVRVGLAGLADGTSRPAEVSRLIYRELLARSPAARPAGEPRTVRRTPCRFDWFRETGFPPVSTSPSRRLCPSFQRLTSPWEAWSSEITARPGSADSSWPARPRPVVTGPTA